MAERRPRWSRGDAHGRLVPAAAAAVAAVDVQAALGLLGARPAALAADCRLRARRAADRRVALVVQGVIRQRALVDAPPDVALAPVRERVVLPEAVRDSSRSTSRDVGARRALLAAQPGDPALGAVERARPAQRPWRASSSSQAPSRDRRSRSRRRPRPRSRSAPRTPARSRASPGRARRYRSSRSSPGLGVPPMRSSSSTSTDSSFWKEQSTTGRLAWRPSASRRRLRRGPAELRSVVAVRSRDGSLRVGQTAHSPSPRITWKGTSRFQSMNWFIVSRPKSTGIERSLTCALERSRCRRAPRNCAQVLAVLASLS